MISYRSAFAFRNSAGALAAGLPRQDQVYKTTDKSFRFHNKNFDEIRCKLDSTENPRSFEKYPTVSANLCTKCGAGTHPRSDGGGCEPCATSHKANVLTTAFRGNGKMPGCIEFL